MKLILATLAIVPCVAFAQTELTDLDWAIARGTFYRDSNVTTAPGLPIQPVLPVPQDGGSWGTGYSIVTTTRPQRSIYDRDVTGSETVQRVVPNDGLGQPMRGLDLGW
jgi:hypothetical protein